MDLLDIILYEGESTSVDFKATAYKPATNPEFIKDVLAMANAQVTGDRYLIVGIKHHKDNSREILGVTPEDQLDDATYHKAILDNIEPEIPFTYSYVEVEGKQVGVFRIHSVDDPPYMMRKDSAMLKIGHSVIRKGTTTLNLRRADIDRMFAQRQATDPFAGKIDVVLAVDGKRKNTVRTCSEAALPSEVARQKITYILEEKRKALQRQQIAEELLKQQAADNWSTFPIAKALEKLNLHTGLDLGNSSIVGPTRPHKYEDRSIEELEKNLQNVKSDYREADQYRKYEELAHKLDFILLNHSEQYVEDCSLTIVLQDEAGVDIATEIFRRPQAPSTFGHFTPQRMILGYPSVVSQHNQYLIRDTIKSVKHGVENSAFQQPLRIFVPMHAAGRQLRFHVTLTAKNLRKPVEKEVVLSIL